jgi:quercetin dioxygenase-like cupin family protein
MALDHARPNQAIDVGPLAAALHTTATHALLKTRSLELIRVVLHAGASIPPHKVPGEITLLCLEGLVDVTTDDGACRLRPSQLVLLPGQAQHGLHALEDSSLLLTIQVPPGAPGSASSTS